MSSRVFSITPIFVMVMFILVFVMIIRNIISGTKQWSKNNNSPILTVDVIVVAKRMDVSQTSLDLNVYREKKGYLC